MPPGSIKLTLLHDRQEACRVFFGPEDVKVGYRNLAELEAGFGITWRCPVDSVREAIVSCQSF